MTQEEYESKSQMKRVEILKAGEKKMTHEELLAKIEWARVNAEGTGTHSALSLATLTSLNALRAVVELHKPETREGPFFKIYYVCAGCHDWSSGKSMYPCPTIQAIEKELK